MSFFFDVISSCKEENHFCGNVLLKYHAEATSSRILAVDQKLKLLTSRAFQEKGGGFGRSLRRRPVDAAKPHSVYRSPSKRARRCLQERTRRPWLGQQIIENGQVRLSWGYPATAGPQ